MVNDLDFENPGGAVTPASISSLPHLKPTEASDSKTRNVIANWLLVLLAAIVIVAFTDLFLINASAPASATIATEAAKRLMDLMNVVFGPVVTLFSSVVGFYFGARTAQEGANAQAAPAPVVTTP